MNDFKATAYHEAGHAVIALHQGIIVRGASIVPDKSSWGHVTYDAANRATLLLTRAGTEKLIRATLAGPIAHRRIDPSSAERGDFIDQSKVAELCVGFARRQQAVIDLPQLIEQTEQMVSDLWREIASLARLLQTELVLTERELLSGVM